MFKNIFFVSVSIFLFSACDLPNEEVVLVEDEAFGEEVVEDERLSESSHFLVELIILKPKEVDTAIDGFRLTENTEISSKTKKQLNEFLTQENITNFPENWKVYQEIKNDSAGKSAVLFGEDCDKNADDPTHYCQRAIYGFFILNLNEKTIEKNHFILEAAMTHTRLQNIKWENDNLISYEILKLHGNPNTGEGNSIEKWQMNTE